jgi:hypothetical protein
MRAEWVVQKFVCSDNAGLAAPLCIIVGNRFAQPNSARRQPCPSALSCQGGVQIHPRVEARSLVCSTSLPGVNTPT